MATASPRVRTPGHAHAPGVTSTASADVRAGRRLVLSDALTRHAVLVAALRRAVFASPGDTYPALRRTAGSGGPLPEPWSAYAEKVRDHSCRVGDDDIAALKAAGRTEEEIFEITIAVATGAGLRRLDAGLRAVRGGDGT